MVNPLRDKKCPACTKAYITIGAAQKHLREKHPLCTEPLIILPPPQGFVDPKVRNILSTTVETSATICSQCPDLPVFPSKTARKKHTREVHPQPPQAPAVPSTSTQGPVQPKRKICHQCPSLPVFVDKVALRKHTREVHYQQCPTCSAIMTTKLLAKHIEKHHRTIPDRIGRMGSSQVTSQLLAPGGLGEPSHETNVSPWDSQGSVISGIYNMSLERFNCDDFDCGRGFSSEVQLESHTRFFHPKNPTQIVEGKREVITQSDDLTEVALQSTEHSPAYFSPASTLSSPLPEERATWGGPEPQGPFESFLGPLTVIQDDVDVPPAVTASTPLSLQCMLCNASPTVGMRPTVTMCGHLFCSECITQHVMSTSSCPVCNDALLLYCLFKLDLPVSS